jgi:lysozyme
MKMTMRTSDAGIALIQEFEGCVLHAYPDPATGAEPWTIGYGHTAGVAPGDTCSREQAVAWLREDLAEAEAAVGRLVTVPIGQPQFDALVSFTFNLGSGALAQSTLLRLLNAGRTAEVGPQFLRWNNGPNGPMPGLTRRRAAERAMFDGTVIHAVAA